MLVFFIVLQCSNNSFVFLIFSALTQRKVQTVGPAYFSYYRIAHQNEESVWLNSNEEIENETEEDVADVKDDLEYLKSLDPKECKVSKSLTRIVVFCLYLL